MSQDQWVKNSHSHLIAEARRLWSCDNFLKMFKRDDYNGALLYLLGSATSLLANHLDGKKSFYAQNKFYRFFGWWWITHYLPIVLSYLITFKRIELGTCGWSQIVVEKKIFPISCSFLKSDHQEPYRMAPKQVKQFPSGKYSFVHLSSE